MNDVRDSYCFNDFIPLFFFGAFNREFLTNHTWNSCSALNFNLKDTYQINLSESIHLIPTFLNP